MAVALASRVYAEDKINYNILVEVIYYTYLKNGKLEE